MSIENKVITRLVQLGQVGAFAHLLTPDFFNETNRTIYDFLQTYEIQYDKCIDEPTFKAQFGEDTFAWEPTELQIEFLIDKLSEQRVEAEVGKLLDDSRAVLSDDPRSISVQLRDSINEICIKYSTASESKSVYLEDGTLARLVSCRKRRVSKGLTGITLGFEPFDEVTSGTQPGEIEIWAARPGNCKSFMLLWTAHRAIRQGKRVTLISPEMSELEMGLRYDSIAYHISQQKLLGGREGDDFFERYIDLISERRRLDEMIGERTGTILFHEAFNFGRPITVGDIAQMIEKDRPEIVMIDGLQFIEPSNSDSKYRDEHQQMNQTLMSIKQLVIKTGVPMRITHQINREATKNMSGKPRSCMTVSDHIPHLHNLAMSGRVEQFANRVICMRFNEGSGDLDIAIRKNRNGKSGVVLSVNLNVDVGMVHDSSLVVHAEDKELELGAIPLDDDDPSVAF